MMTMASAASRRGGVADGPFSRAQTLLAHQSSASPTIPTRSAHESGTRLREQLGVDALKRASSRPVQSVAQPRSARRQPQRGDLIAERFQLFEQLGSGSSSLVFRAHDLTEDRPVALKLLRPELVSHTDLAERLRYEAQLAGSLFSPHIVEVMSLGQLENNSGYFVMELLDGETLAQYLRGPLPSYAAIKRIGMHIALGLMAAHDKGITHRDLKPDNIFITRTTESELIAKVMDFGVAKHPNAVDLTRPGTVLGTPHYMAPEQAIAVSDVDHRADIYALGGILFEMVSGQPVFDYDDSMALVMAQLQEQPRRLDEVRSDVPSGLSELVARCLEKKPEDRIQTAAAVLQALHKICTQENEVAGCQGERAITMLAVADAPRTGLFAPGRAVSDSGEPAPATSGALAIMKPAAAALKKHRAALLLLAIAALAWVSWLTWIG